MWVDADVLDRLDTAIGSAAVAVVGRDGQRGYLVQGEPVGPAVIAQLVDHGSDESAVFVDRERLTPES